MKNLLLPGQNSLKTIISKISDGEFAIPDFQRPFEWKPADVCELVKSIFEDYFIGTLLFWRASQKNLESLECLPVDLDKREFLKNAQYIVLDGQQRLTAMFYAFISKNNYFNKKKRCYFFIKLDKWLEGSSDDSFVYYWGHNNISNLVSSQTEQVAQGYFPLSLIGEKQKNMIKWFDEYELHLTDQLGKDIAREKRNEAEEKIDDILDNYSVSFISLDQDIEVAKVCDIFTRLNNTGIKLTIFDLMNAILRPKGIKLKKLWEDISSVPEFNLVESDKMKISILQTISILKQGYCSPKYLYYLAPGQKKVVKRGNGKLEKVVLVETPSEFSKEWDRSVELSKRALAQLCNPVDFGVVSKTFFPYPTLVPVLSAFLSIQDRDYKNSSINKKIRKWYWSSIFTKNYSSSVDTQMTKDYYEMQRYFNDDNAIPQVVLQVMQDINSLNLEKETSQSSAIYKAVFNIFVKMGASDLVTGIRPEYSILNDHHIVPNSWGKKNKLEKEINTILNRTPLSEKTNKEIIHDSLPNVYLKKIMSESSPDEFNGLMKSHLISNQAVQILLREDFSRTDFLEFIEERKRSIITEIKKLVGCDLSIEEQIQEDSNEVLKEIEIEIRDFIDKVLKNNMNADYWEDAIPQHIDAKVKSRLKVDQTSIPYMAGLNTPRKKIDYLDMSEYCDVILKNWVFFEKYFLNRENLTKHFKHLSDFRNPVKHIREKQEVADKLGEAAIIWLKGSMRNELSGDTFDRTKELDDEFPGDVLSLKVFWDHIRKFSENIARITFGKEDGIISKFSLKIDSRFKTQITLFRLKSDGDIKFLFGEIERKDLSEDVVSSIKDKIIKIFDGQVERISNGGAYYFNVNIIINNQDKINDLQRVVKEFVDNVKK